MKKLFLFLLLLPAVTFGQESQKKSAEDFVTGFLKMFEEKKRDDILKSCSDDGQMIWPNHSITSLPEMMTSIVNNNKIEMTSDKIDIEWITADVVGPASAMVTVSYLETTDRSGNVCVKDNLDVYLLELKEGNWKIKKLIPQDNYPLIYNKNIDEKFRTGGMGPLTRFNGALIQYAFKAMCDLEILKNEGISPAEVGKIIGKRDTKIDRETRNFEGIATEFVWGIQSISTYTEVLERNENTLKLKFIPFLVSEKWGSGVTNEDIRIMMENLFKIKSADSMGGECSLEVDGKYWILKLNKK